MRLFKANLLLVGLVQCSLHLRCIHKRAPKQFSIYLDSSCEVNLIPFIVISNQALVYADGWLIQRNIVPHIRSFALNPSRQALIKQVLVFLRNICAVEEAC